ncbi:hypothetical protein HAQ04_19175 [Pseudomonas sp. C2L11]|nr:hypothetical protein [Pseudomonas typographi]
MILKACAQAQFSPNVVQHARQMPPPAGLVAGGMGVALMPSLFLDAVQPRGVALMALYGEGALIAYELAMVYRPQSVLISKPRFTSPKACLAELASL